MLIDIINLRALILAELKTNAGEGGLDFVAGRSCLRALVCCPQAQQR